MEPHDSGWGRQFDPDRLASLELEPGDEVILRLEDDELRLTTLKHRIARAQRNARKYIPRGVSLADELIAERREAARRE